MTSSNLFRKLSSILYLFISNNLVWADLPYFPLEFRLTTGASMYYEGDKIDFVLTVKNKDKNNTYPLLIPGNRSNGNKLIYFRVYDPDTKVFIQRAIESREMKMNVKQLGDFGMLMLGPEKQISFNLYWNDSINFLTQVDSHHSFDQPLFAGSYMFQAFYNPFETGMGDTLYNLLQSTEDEQIDGKLNFLGPALSIPCLVNIKPKNTGAIRIDNIYYWCALYGEEESKGGLYYLKDHWDLYGNSANCLREVAIDFTKGYVYAEVNHTYYGKGSYQGSLARKNTRIFRDSNGDIRDYTLSDEGMCPSDYYSRIYQTINESTFLYQQVDTLQDGIIHTILYNENGTINTERFEAFDFYRVTTITYVYQDGILKRKIKNTKGHKTKKRKRGPCLVVLL